MALTTPSTTLSLGDRLARAREAAGLGQEDLARALNVSRATISNYENDVRGKVPFDVVCDWARATGVPLAFFADATLGDGETTNGWYPVCNLREDPGAMVMDLSAGWPNMRPAENLEHPGLAPTG